MLLRSPADELSINEVPLEHVHVEDVEVKWICLDAVELSISTDLRLPLVEVWLRACLAIQLLDVVRASVEQVAVVCFLITRGEAAEDEDVLVGNLVQATSFQAYPVCVLFNAQVESLPVLSPLDVVLLDQVRPLTSVEAGYNIESLVVESNRCMEVAACIQAGNLRPCIASHIIHLALVHWLTGQGASNGVDARARPASKDGCQRVSPSLKDHVSPLLQPLVYELIARLGGLARLTASRQEYPAFLVLDGHEVCWYLDVDDIWSIWVSAEIVHEQVVRVVDEEMECVDHFPVVAYQWHLDRLLDYFRYCLLGPLLLLEQLNLHLLLWLLQEELGLPDDLFAFLESFLNLTRWL